MSEAISQPLRIVLVADADQSLSDAQAQLIQRLNDDPAIELSSRLTGERKKGGRVLPLVLRGVLACERRLMRGRVQSYDTSAAREILAQLPEGDGQGSAIVCDLAIALGARRLADNELGLLRYGEWALSFAGSDDPRWIGAAPEVRAKPRIELEILGRNATNPDPAVIRSTSYNPKPGAVLTGAFVAEKSVLFMHRALRDLVTERDVPLEETSPVVWPRLPGTLETVSYARSFLKTASHKLAEQVRTRRNRMRQYWRVSEGVGSVLDFEPRNARDLPVQAHVMADPFLFRSGENTWLFYEAMHAGGGKGWIEVAGLKDDGVEPSAVALKRPYHLSYPFVFSVGADIFMIPETQESRRLEVWRATAFPLEWELHATAFEGQLLAETSLYQDENGQWWLLTNISDHYAFQDHSSELYLFAVDGPDLKSITPHPRNPVVFGADRARNGGAIIRYQDRVFRPAQNNSYGVYGYGLNLMEILRLDATGYEERLVREFTPNDKPGSIAMHHLSVAGDRYVLDWCGE
ncbi:hypothetical protein N4R57_11635 [Rhodobacteraceae bacterium D3-12]|nr:hypothetical protein N4R57_11635 [Rhodobacteraceae bacterium D3-12]